CRLAELMTCRLASPHLLVPLSPHSCPCPVPRVPRPVHAMGENLDATEKLMTAEKLMVALQLVIRLWDEGCEMQVHSSSIAIRPMPCVPRPIHVWDEPRCYRK
ncbi:MAG: hypothetical protein ACK4I8_03870, partial [Armatimonadota bacterium]